MLPVEGFLKYIKQHALFGPADKVLLAVSGGKDSVLMVHLFKQAKLDFSIAHCNFNLREEESQRDEAFVHLLATSMGVPFFLKQFDTSAYAAEHKISIQMAARELRYNWFKELADLEGFSRVALAHHQNDAIETVLINLVRGTGISGLHGIRPKHDHIVRPLLFLSGAEIETLIDEHGISFVEDSSNQQFYYARNRIRHFVIPQLREINPALEQTFEKNIRRFAEVEQVLGTVVDALRPDLCRTVADGIAIDIHAMQKLEPRKLLSYELLKPYHFSETTVDDLLAALDAQTGTSFYSPTHRATINRDELLITPNTGEHNEIIMWHADQRSVIFLGQKLELTVTGQLPWQFDPASAYVDYEQLIFPLVLRTWQQGDTFIPLGMKGTKKLSDFFIDSKVPLPVKEQIPILINGNSQVVWIGGLRQDDRFKVNTTTKKVAIFELKK